MANSNRNRITNSTPQPSPSRRSYLASPTVAPDVAANLRRTFSGLDKNLHYVQGHALHRDYSRYKAASEVADRARAEYDNDAARLILKAPYESYRLPGGPVGGDNYFPEDHARLAELADEAARAAQV
jgi:hypothetical protein